MKENVTPPTELSLTQLKLIDCLLQGKSQREAAALVGIEEVTIWRWKQEPAFKEALRQAKASALESAVTKLVGVTEEAIDVLVALMRSEKRQTALQSRANSIRLRAAQVILEQTIKLTETLDFAERLAKLEEVNRDTNA